MLLQVALGFFELGVGGTQKVDQCSEIRWISFCGLIYIYTHIYGLCIYVPHYYG